MSNMPEASSALFIAQYSEDAISDAIQRVSKVIFFHCMKLINLIIKKKQKDTFANFEV